MLGFWLQFSFNCNVSLQDYNASFILVLHLSFHVHALFLRNTVLFLNCRSTFLQHILGAVVKHIISTWLLLVIGSNKLFIGLFIIDLFLVVASISIITLTGISNPLCISGDLRCLNLFMTSASTTPPLFSWLCSISLQIMAMSN